MRWVKANERLPGLKDESTLDCDDSVVVRRFVEDQKEIYVVELGQVEVDDEWLENALEGMTKE